MFFPDITADNYVDITDERDIARHCNSMNQGDDTILDLFMNIMHNNRGPRLVGGKIDIKTKGFVDQIKKRTIKEIERQEKDGTFGFGIKGEYKPDYN